MQKENRQPFAENDGQNTQGHSSTASPRIVCCRRLHFYHAFPAAFEMASHFTIMTGATLKQSDIKKLQIRIHLSGCAVVVCEDAEQAEYVASRIKLADSQKCWSVEIVNPFALEDIF